MKFAICIPSILDVEIVSKTVPAIKENIIEANPAVFFTLFSNVDNFRQEDCEGSKEDILELYSSLESKNCKVDIQYSENRKGYNGATEYLLNKFINSDSEYCMFYDDDHKIINPMPITSMYKSFSDDKVFHFGNTYSKCSSENPWINEAIQEIDSYVVASNVGSFYTYPGTVLSKSQAVNIFSQASFKNTTDNAEVVIGSTPFYKSLPVYSIFHKHKSFKLLAEGPFRIPLDCHYSLDLRRYARKTCSDLGNYN